MKKIAIFIPSLRGGGVEKSMVNLANAIVKRGVSVDLLVTNAVGPNLVNISKQVNLINFKKNHVCLCLFRLIDYLKHNSPCSLLSAMTHVNVIALLANILTGRSTRIIISVRTYLSASLYEEKKIKSKIVLFLSKYLYRGANKIVAVSQNVAKDVINLYKLPESMLRTIYNPILTRELFELAERKIDHDWLREECECPLILSVGRLEEVKNFELLIKAFAILIKQVSTARLLILGEGTLRPKLEKLISNLNMSDRVVLPGYVNNPYVFMKNCSLFVLSSRYDGLPGALIGALALSPRIVTTDCPGGSREILANGKYGKLVAVDDVEELANSMLETLQSKPKRCSDDVHLAKFKPETVVQQYLQILLSEDE